MSDFEDVKKLISSILISNPLQMTIQRLDRDFTEQIGHPIPYTKFGFKSLELCLNAMTDILEVRGFGWNALVIVHVSDKTAHIDKLIAHQKPKTSKKHFGSRPKPRNHSRGSPIPLNHHYIQGPVPYYIPPLLRAVTKKPLDHSVLSSEGSKDVKPSLISPSRAVRRRSIDHTDVSYSDVSKLQPLMLTKVLPPKDFIPPTTTRSNQKVKNVSEIKVSSTTKERIEKEVDTVQLSQLSHVDTHGATSSECSNAHNGIVIHEDQDNNDIYLSDEEEPLNMRVPLRVQQNLQALINQQEDGLWCAKIPEVYRKLFNKELEYEEYGYKSLIQMCMDLKSIFFWYRPDKGDFKLYDRTKPPPNDLDKHYKQSDFIKTFTYLSTQPSTEPPVADIDELIPAEPEECYPPEVARLLDVIPRQFIPKDHEEEYIDVCVGEVYDPSKFWLMLRDYTPLLDKLMDDMQTFYYNRPDLKIPEHMIKLGLYCAAVYNNEYHRAIIVNLRLNQKDRVKVFYVDYGTVNSTLKEKLHFLHKSFFDLPQQAIRARLARIYPPTANTMWTTDTSTRFLNMIKMKTLVAQLDHVDYNNEILEVFLVDTSGDEDIFMNDELVTEELAIFTSEQQKQIPIDLRFTPTVTYLHLIPTFDELEQGLVPNASEMIRLQRYSVNVEQILPHYFNLLTEVNAETERPQEETKKKSSVAVRRQHLQSLTEARYSQDRENAISNDTLSIPEETVDLTEVAQDRNLPIPEIKVSKLPVRPPPGFERIQEQKIITAQKLNGDQLVNTTLTQTITNVDNQFFELGNLYPNQQQPVPNAAAATAAQSYTSDMFNRIIASGINPSQLGHIYPNPYLSYISPSIFNAAISHPNQQQFHYANMQGFNQANNSTTYYNRQATPLRLHMQECIKELLLANNKITINRFLSIIKRRLLTSGPHHGLFSLLPTVLNGSVQITPSSLEQLVDESFCFLSDDDIIDITHEIKAHTSINPTNSATTRTQYPVEQAINRISHKVEELHMTDRKYNVDYNNIRNSSESLHTNSNNMHKEIKQLVLELDFQNHKLHVLNLENKLYVMVTQILQILNRKMPIERIRKCLVMTDPSVSVLDVRIQDHNDLFIELSRYIYVDSTTTINLIPFVYVPKLINAIGERTHLATCFDEFLKRLNISNYSDVSTS